MTDQQHDLERRPPLQRRPVSHSTPDPLDGVRADLDRVAPMTLAAGVARGLLDVVDLPCAPIDRDSRQQTAEPLLWRRGGRWLMMEVSGSYVVALWAASSRTTETQSRMSEGGVGESMRSAAATRWRSVRAGST